MSIPGIRFEASSCQLLEENDVNAVRGAQQDDGYTAEK